MRFAIATCDRYLGVFAAFVQAGWKPLKLFTCPARHELANQHLTIAYAEQNKAAIQLSRMTERDLNELREMGCEALVVASYEWKIPDWRAHLSYAVNFHSSPLPHGRGPYPAVRAILEGWNHWAITCHQISPQFDRGHILAVEKFPLSVDECHESIDLKIQMAAKRLAVRVAGRFLPLWEQATPQDAGSYWRRCTLRERMIDFRQPVEKIVRHIRAFGQTESLAHLNNSWLIVKRAVGWTEPHRDVPGSVVHRFNRSIVVAAHDGFIGLLESCPAPAHLITELQTELHAPARAA
ncbi:MAG TPA: formyltransferase family protein [Burkholderiales bacterium]|nr:formyltransferase family protein [Burkholderiales bacterium]